MTTKLLALSLLAACATEDLTAAEQDLAGRFTLLPDAGTGQKRVVMNAFSPLVVTLTDWDNAPLEGISVTFTTPALGASAIFTGSNRVLTDEFGQARITPWASTLAGTYTVWAAADNADAMPFVLTNTAAAPSALVPVLGAAQTQTAGQAFGQRLTVEVRDAYGNPVEGATVTFAAPTSGGATLVMPAGNEAVSDAAGRASVAAMAGDVPGTYVVEAKASGTPVAYFRLTNVAPADRHTLTGGTPNTSVAFEPAP